MLHQNGATGGSGGGGCSMINNCGVNSILGNNNPLAKVREMIMTNNVVTNKEVRFD